MILNLSADSGAVLLDLVDKGAASIGAKIPRMIGEKQENAIIYLQHLGIAKHRLEHNLACEPPFRGPIEWGYPLRGRPPRTIHGPFPKLP